MPNQAALRARASRCRALVLLPFILPPGPPLRRQALEPLLVVLRVLHPERWLVAQRLERGAALGLATPELRPRLPVAVGADVRDDAQQLDRHLVLPLVAPSQ